MTLSEETICFHCMLWSFSTCTVKLFLISFAALESKQKISHYTLQNSSVVTSVITSVIISKPMPLAAIQAHAIILPPQCLTDDVVLKHFISLPTFLYSSTSKKWYSRPKQAFCFFVCFLKIFCFVLFLSITSGLNLEVKLWYLCS